MKAKTAKKPATHIRKARPPRQPPIDARAWNRHLEDMVKRFATIQKALNDLSCDIEKFCDLVR